MDASQLPYEHPIFWTKETRRNVEEHIARASLAECRQRREQERIQKILERAQVIVLIFILLSYIVLVKNYNFPNNKITKIN